MLVLTRRVDAGDGSIICIGTDIEVTLVATHGEQVRVDVQAPADVAVDRKEIWEQKQEEKNNA